MRVAIDTGGTFTDLALDGADGRPVVFKAPTVPIDPAQGVLDVLTSAADASGTRLQEFLDGIDTIVHGTTIALNAIVTASTARTAFVTTRGHPDILTLREGGRLRPFDSATPFPSPYVPRQLTFEVDERVAADGAVVRALEDPTIDALIADLRAADVGAVAVCLLWSMIAPDHERRIGEAIERSDLDVPVSLSHQVNPIIREYRRASSTCLDASLRPIMQGYLDEVARRLRGAGFRGRLLVVTSQGGVRDAADIAMRPVHAIGSGPAMAPIAGRNVLADTADASGVPERRTAIVIDTGGTTFDVSVVRDGRVPRRTDMWIGEQFSGHMTGFPGVDVSSIGAGGGSIAWVDHGGLLRVGPKSAGADPGPACFGRGGTDPTFTDACLVMGLLDAHNFFNGGMDLDIDAAHAAIDRAVAGPLGLATLDAAEAVYQIGTESMVTAVEDVTIARGIDPRQATLIAGGGAAGLNAVEIARRLGCPDVLLPRGGAALSAVGGLHSDLVAEYTAVGLVDLDALDGDDATNTLDELERSCREFAARVTDADTGTIDATITYSIEARYRSQAWEIDVAFERPSAPDHLPEVLRERFDAVHHRLFGFCDSGSPIEVVTWRATVACRADTSTTGRSRSGHDGVDGPASASHGSEVAPATRPVRWPGAGTVDSVLVDANTVGEGWATSGPAVVTTSYTTTAVPPGVVVSSEPTGLAVSLRSAV